MFEISYSEIIAIIQVVFIDLVLAGDNAIVVGMAAASVQTKYRKKVIFYGIALAVVTRIAFAVVTLELLNIVGLMFVGGLLLLWVCWKLYRDVRQNFLANTKSAEATNPNGAAAKNLGGDVPRKTLTSAIIQVAIADISMSLDNVLAVAGAANNHMTALVIGLALSVVLMGIGATLIAKLLQRHHWIGYFGLVLVFYVAVSMTWRGGWEFFNVLSF